MSEENITKALLKGGHFLLNASSEEEIFTPEDFNEEQIMIADTAQQFVIQDHRPLADLMEEGEHTHNRTLLKKLGDLGFLGTHMPEEYGGLALDTNTNSLITEIIGRTGAFSTTFGAHTGIGMLPILYFGTKEQKEKYLPDLISADKVACYCLTEPGSGSDALAAKSKAILSEDNSHYVLNGQKMWISNAGFADIFIVFAKVSGKDFTGFIVESGWKGLSLGAEEKKLGIKGSSTRQVFFENVKVPVENVLGEIGKGHLIAFNVLNTGRFKIGPSALGGSKGLLEVSAKYAIDRNQFGTSISNFGAIKSKLADQYIQTYISESVTYRTSGLINDYVKDLEHSGLLFEEAKLKAAEEYALESSILKVACTDMVNHIADECVQIHGGMGYSEETMAARGYRDSRIAMIYEGTNEINRLLIMNIIFKRAMKGQFDFTEAALKVQQELITGKNGQLEYKSPEQRAVSSFKKVALMLIGSVGQLAMKGKLNLKHEQEILMNISNVIIDVFLAESLYLRQQKNSTAINDAALKVFFRSANENIRSQALEAIGSYVKPELQERFAKGVDKFCAYPLVNVKELKRQIADHVIEHKGYKA